MSEAPVKLSPPTDQHPVFLQAGCLSCRPTNSVKAQKGKHNKQLNLYRSAEKDPTKKQDVCNEV